ncbi:MAG TPA: polysaccharide biosynthesis C-terminal domain-containing protein [Steroidobacteraceae bacterium]
MKAAKGPSTPKLAFFRSLGSAAGSKLGSAICGVVTFGFLARALGARGLGEYRTVLTLLLFGGAIFDFGLYPLTLREISLPQVDRTRIIGSAVGLRLVSMFVGVALMSAVVAAAGFDSTVRKGVLIVGIGWVALQLHEMLKAVFQFKLAQQRSAVAEISGAALSLLLVIGLAQVSVGTDGMLVATAVGFCVTGCMAWYYARRLVPFRPQMDFPMWRHFIVTCGPLAASAILLIVRLRVDLLLLAVFRPPAEVGLYDAPVKLYELLLSLASILGGLLTPAFIRDLRTGETIARRLNAGLTVMAIFSGLAFAVLFSCAEPIVTLLAGPDYTSSARPLRIIAAAASFMGLTSILRFGAIALDQQSRMARADLAGVAFALVVNLILIPQLGLMGAAVGRLVGDIVTLAVAAWSLRAYLRFRMLSSVVIGILACVCLTVVLQLTTWINVPWFVALALGGPAVLGCMLLLPRVRSELGTLTAVIGRPVMSSRLPPEYAFPHAATEQRPARSPACPDVSAPGSSCEAGRASD